MATSESPTQVKDYSSNGRNRETKVQNDTTGSSVKKEVRIFMEGAFDMMHFGHMNAFRLGRSLGTHLIVGINSDESISACKAPPLMNHSDRMAMVQSCKFVDQVIPNTPYIMNKEYIDWVIATYNIDYIVHGEDPCIVDGKDVYETAKQAGKFRTIPRTEGVSTTDIVGRMLQLTRAQEDVNDKCQNVDNMSLEKGYLGMQSKFLTTTRILQQFSANHSAFKPTQTVVYIDGAWDMLHPGHMSLLEAVKKGDYLIVGVHSDATVNRIRGGKFPLFNLHERVLGVLGCRYVDDVLIDAPYQITPEMIATLGINKIVHGVGFEDLDYSNKTEERYQHAKAAGILHVVQSLSTYCLERVFERIRTNQETFQSRFDKKMKEESEHYSQKYSDTTSGAEGNKT